MGTLGSLSMSNCMSEYSAEVDNESYGSFLGIREGSYEIAIKNFNELFKNL
jgi:hypothetical protein